MITHTNSMTLDPIQIASAKPLEDFVAVIDLAFKRYSRSVAYVAREIRVYAIVLNDANELEPMAGRDADREGLPIVAYLDISASKRLMSSEVVITTQIYDRSKEPTIMDRFERLAVLLSVRDEVMRSRGCKVSLSGDDALTAIRKVLWEGAA